MNAESRRPVDTGRQQTRQSLDIKIRQRSGDPRHPLCESHIKRHFCVGDIWRRRARAEKLKRLCGGVR